MNKFSRLIATASLVLASALAPSASFAHSDIVSTTPAAGSTVEAGTVDIVVEFNEDLLQDANSAGSEIKVVETSTGNELMAGCVYVEGSRLHARAALDVDGGVTVTWRTVADDGHPVSESYEFNVSNPDGIALTDPVGFCEGGRTYAEGTDISLMYQTKVDIAPQPTPTSTTSNDSSGGLLGLGVGIAFIVVFAVIGGLQTKRRLDKEARKNR